MTFNPNNGIWRIVWINILTLLIGGSLGFGTSQLFIVNDVRQAKSDILYLREADLRNEREVTGLETRTNERIVALSGMMEKSIALNQELVSLVKVQNELLTRGTQNGKK